MKIKRTIPIAIEGFTNLIDIVSEYNRFQREISPIAFNGGKNLNAIELHRAVYHTVPTKLSAQMKCSAIRAVVAAYTAARTNRKPVQHPFIFRKKAALFLYGKDFSFLKRNGLLSITTMRGREKIQFRVPAYAEADFKTATSYDSMTVTGNGRMLLCLTLEVPDPAGNIPVGIDLGATNALVASTASDTLFISGLSKKISNKKTRKVRQRLQKKLADRKAHKEDTHSVRRLLKRLGRKQSNRTKTFCGETAAKLCSWVPKDSVLVFEDLRIKQVRKGRKNRSGTNRKLSQWFFNAMIQACVRKAERMGIAISYINPAYTSQRCCKCGKIGVRWGHRFSCECGHADHADVNASHNIRLSFTVLRSSGPLSIGPEAHSMGKPIALS